MKKTELTTIAILILILASASSFAAVPNVINYQGMLTDSGDEAVDGAQLMKFIVYDASSGGNELYNSSFQTVTISNGLFDVQLGTAPWVALPDTIFEGSDRWLGITIESDSEMSPRIRLRSSRLQRGSE